MEDGKGQRHGEEHLMDRNVALYGGLVIDPFLRIGQTHDEARRRFELVEHPLFDGPEVRVAHGDDVLFSRVEAKENDSRGDGRTSVLFLAGTSCGAEGIEQLAVQVDLGRAGVAIVQRQ